MRFFKNWVLSLACVCGLAFDSQAGFVFVIGDVEKIAGSDSTVVVPVSVTTPNGAQFGVFNMGIDVTPNSNAIVSGISFNATPVSGSTLFNSPTVNFQTPALRDFFMLDAVVNSNTASGTSLPTNVTTNVFNLRFDVGAGVPVGSYDINFKMPAGLTNVTTDGGTILTLDNGAAGAGNTYAVFSGSINVTAVPEPSSFALAGVALVGAAVFVRRRRTYKNRTVA